MTFIKLLNKFKILWDNIVGYIIKIYYDLLDFDKLPLINDLDKNPNLIVSLTSYGRRVNKRVAYTLISILRQTIKPNKIILWLDNENWNDENIPPKLKKLKSKGIEIRFCADYKSYKKLIPTLQEFKDSVIITVDDDVIYHRNLIECLYSEYLKDNSKIYCTHALKPIVTAPNQFASYMEWKDLLSGEKSDYIFPIGEGGILYPPNSLHNDVLNIELVSKLCPQADDIWFWIMAYKKNTRHSIVKIPKAFFQLDAIYQYFHKGTALTHSNAKQNKNDVQLQSVIDYYKIKFDTTR